MAIISDLVKMPLPIFKTPASTGKILADIQGHMQTMKNLGCHVDEQAIIKDEITFKQCDVMPGTCINKAKDVSTKLLSQSTLSL